MFKIAALLLLIAGAGQVAPAQNGPPQLLRQASHCLATGRRDWLAVHNSNVKSPRVGYVIDTKSDPGTHHIYIMVYTNSQHSKGRVFDLLYERRGNVTTFDIQNNATFVESRGRVAFVAPPLGGTWAHTHLQSAVKRAGHDPIITLDVVDLLVPFSDVSCKSYAGSE